MCALIWVPPSTAQRGLETVAGGGLLTHGPWAGRARRKAPRLASPPPYTASTYQASKYVRGWSSSVAGARALHAPPDVEGVAQQVSGTDLEREAGERRS